MEERKRWVKWYQSCDDENDEDMDEIDIEDDINPYCKNAGDLIAALRMDINASSITRDEDIGGTSLVTNRLIELERGL